MKNLANCKPSEFLIQTNRIKKSVENWLTLTDILNIRKRLPKLDVVTKDMSDEEKKELIQHNKAISDIQVKKNLSDILDAILDKHPKETLELLALLCFVEPKDVDNYPMEEYLKSFTELISNEAVIGFFISLASLAQKNTSTVFKA